MNAQSATLLGLICLLSPSESFPMGTSSISFKHLAKTSIGVTPDKSSGLSGIYVLDHTKDAILRVKKISDTTPEFYIFHDNGVADAVKQNSVISNDGFFELSLVSGSYGVIIDYGNKTDYFWIIDYSESPFSIEDLLLDNDINCLTSILDFRGNAKPIYYTGITGKKYLLDREIEVVYDNLEWDKNELQFVQKVYRNSLPYITDKITITPPLYCKSSIEITGDKFLKEWDESVTYEETDIVTQAVEVRSEIIEETDAPDDNLINSGDLSKGGSAPYTISFRGYVSDNVIHKEWQMSSDINFDNIHYRITEQDFSYTFLEEGTTYVRFIGSNYDGSCEAIGETYTITIGSSELLAPNIFTPNGDGINDEWKVSYKSILDFQCWIFDRYGKEIIHFNDPGMGWDGTLNGNKVKSGVYYYVINAKGSDGKHYNLSGDINIIFSKRNVTSSDIE